MNISIISFTENGLRLSKKVAESLGTDKVEVFTKCSLIRDDMPASYARFLDGGIDDWAKEQMEEKRCLIFVGACGIAVRAIAPFITDKLHDSAVLVMDERGEYIIPILSGHMGGANEIAGQIARKMGAIPVITTATDINKKFAVDLFAKHNGLHIENRDGIARVSAKALGGRQITISVEPGHMEENIRLPKEVTIVPYPPGQAVDVVVTTGKKDFNALICLKPKEYVIGMGCKKGKEKEKIEQFIDKSMREAGIIKDRIFALASIDRKDQEEGFLEWSSKENISFLTFSAEQLRKIEGDFHTSAFVEKQIGVDNVCERAALMACEYGGRLIYEKHAEDGMTIAIAKREWRISFDEE